MQPLHITFEDGFTARPAALNWASPFAQNGVLKRAQHVLNVVATDVRDELKSKHLISARFAVSAKDAIPILKEHFTSDQFWTITQQDEQTVHIKTEPPLWASGPLFF